MTPLTTGAAVFSDDGLYRYRLTRTWDESRPSCLYVMLNPSTADAETDDPTICRCIGFADRAGFGGLTVTNLFAWRATDPRELRTMPVSKIGSGNDEHIRQCAERVDTVIAAWGALPKSLRWRAHDVAALLPRHTVCLGLTKTAAPRHPLYVAGDTSFVLLATGRAS